MRIGILLIALGLTAGWTDSLQKKPASQLLSKAFIAKTFAVPEADVFQSNLNRTTVLFSWDKPNAEAIRARNKKILAERGRFPKPLREGETREELQRDRAMVHLSYSVQTDEATAERIVSEAFRKDSTALGQVSHGQVKKFRVNYDVILEDIGDRGAWSASHRQMTVRKGAMIFHLHIDVDRTKDFERARKVMAEALTNL